MLVVCLTGRFYYHKFITAYYIRVAHYSHMAQVSSYQYLFLMCCICHYIIVFAGEDSVHILWNTSISLLPRFHVMKNVYCTIIDRAEILLATSV